jgi:hypothetical protein
LILLDFSKAFDKVPHKHLLVILELSGIFGGFNIPMQGTVVGE